MVLLFVTESPGSTACSDFDGPTHTKLYIYAWISSLFGAEISLDLMFECLLRDCFCLKYFCTSSVVEHLAISPSLFLQGCREDLCTSVGVCKLLFFNFFFWTGRFGFVLLSCWLLTLLLIFCLFLFFFVNSYQEHFYRIKLRCVNYLVSYSWIC